jgi:hypothetical protein
VSDDNVIMGICGADGLCPLCLGEDRTGSDGCGTYFRAAARSELLVPDAPTQTVRVAQLAPGDRVIVPMVGNVETVLTSDGGLVSTDGTGPGSAYMWGADDPIDVVSRTTGSSLSGGVA